MKPCLRTISPITAPSGIWCGRHTIRCRSQTDISYPAALQYRVSGHCRLWYCTRCNSFLARRWSVNTHVLHRNETKKPRLSRYPVHWYAIEGSVASFLQCFSRSKNGSCVRTSFRTMPSHRLWRNARADGLASSAWSLNFNWIPTTEIIISRMAQDSLFKRVLLATTGHQLPQQYA